MPLGAIAISAREGLWKPPPSSVGLADQRINRIILLNLNKKITRRTTGSQGNNFQNDLNYILTFFSLAWCTSIYLGLYLSISVHIAVSWSISLYLGVSQFILVFVSFFRAILAYLGLSHAKYGYMWWLSPAIFGYLELSLSITHYFYQVSCIRLQVEVGESKLLLFCK